MGCSLLSIIEIFYFVISGFLASWSRPRTSPDIERNENQRWAQNSAKNPSVIRLEDKVHKSDEKLSAVLTAINDLTKTVHENDLKMKNIVREFHKKILILEEKYENVDEFSGFY